MANVGVRVREAAIRAIGWLLTGRPLPARERRRLRSEVSLFGFRAASFGHLLRRMHQERDGSGSPILLVRALDGLFTLAVSADDLAVGRAILTTGTYEPHIAAFYRGRLRPGMTVVDVGANVGFHALHAAVLVAPAGRVLAFEPDPRNAALLRLSLGLAGGHLAVQVAETALSDTEGEITITDLGNRGNSGARFTHPDGTLLERLVHGPDPWFARARAVRFDDRFPQERIDLVKIDIEGYEPRALRGMEGSLARHRPIVVSEYAPSNLRDLGGVDPPAYLAWFRDRGYDCAVLPHDGEGRLAPADAREIERRLDGRHHLDLVFTPS